MADRVLDIAPRQGGHDEGGGDRKRPPHPADLTRPRAREDDDRPLPEVDAVGPDADPAQRTPPQRAAQPARRVDHRGEHRHRRDRQQDEPVGIEEGRNGARPPDENDDAEQTRNACGVERLAHRRAASHPRGAARPDHRESGAQEKAERASVGALVDAGRVVARVIEEAHRNRRARRAEQNHEGEHAAAPHRPDPEQQQPRPHQVELLLDRERPEVVKRKRRREACEVRAVLGDRRPVVEVPECRDHLPSSVRELCRVEEGRPDAHDREHHEQRREQPPCPPQPELAQPEVSVLPPMTEQEVGDQVAGEREEDADAEHPSASRRQPEVVRDHEQYRDGAHAVEAGHIRPAGLRWPRHP